MQSASRSIRGNLLWKAVEAPQFFARALTTSRAYGRIEASDTRRNA